MKKIAKILALPIFILSLILNLSINSNGDISIANKVAAAAETTTVGIYQEITVDCLDANKNIYAQVKACAGGLSKDCNPDTGCPPVPTTPPDTSPDTQP